MGRWGGSRMAELELDTDQDHPRKHFIAWSAVGGFTSEHLLLKIAQSANFTARRHV